MKTICTFASGLIVGGLLVGIFPPHNDLWLNQGHRDGWRDLYGSLAKHFNDATDAEEKASTAFIDYNDARICIVEVDGVKTIRLWR